MFPNTLTLPTLQETNRIGQALAKFIRPPMTIGLKGELGAGKTTLTKAVLSSLGYRESVSSPTFVLQHQYELGKHIVSHWDLYRLTAPPEELFQPRLSNEIAIIEWPDKFSEILSLCDLVLTLEVTATPNDSLSISRKCIITGRLSEDFCRTLWAKN